MHSLISGLLLVHYAPVWESLMDKSGQLYAIAVVQMRGLMPLASACKESVHAHYCM
jgi:hypothetical protein